DGLADVVQSFPQLIGSGNQSHRLFLNVLDSIDHDLNYSPLDSQAVTAAMPRPLPPLNTFLSSNKGFSALGFWGNQSGESILWLRDPQASSQTYGRVAAVPPASPPKPWAWNLGGCVPNIQPQHLIADIDGDGMPDGFRAEVGVAQSTSEIAFTRKTPNSP